MLCCHCLLVVGFFMPFVFVRAGAVYIDTAYGYGLFPWDVQITTLWLRNVLKQVDAMRTNDDHIAVLFSKILDVSMINDVLIERKYADVTQIYWQKPGQIMVGSNKKYTPCVEVATIGFFPNASAIEWYTSDQPVLRHNFIQIPSVKALAKAVDGEPINVCQKPPEVSKFILGNHCTPGTNVLVVGAGAGGDILGAVQAGLNVVAVEVDKRQFDALRGHLESLIGEYKEAKINASQGKQKKTKQKEAAEDPAELSGPTLSPSKKQPTNNVQLCHECDVKLPDIDPDVDKAKHCYECGEPLCDDCGKEEEYEGDMFFICSACDYDSNNDSGSED